jgi:NitT/TauT family transport system substrate-binding protein
VRFGIAGAALALMLAAVPAGAETVIKMGVVPALPTAPVYIGIEKGYFRADGITVELTNLDSAARGIALLARGDLQVLEGGIAVGYFNAVAKGLPMIMSFERGSTPVQQKLVLRPDLKGKIVKVADLKGHSVAVVAPGSILVYELGKVLETAGLTLQDVDVKYLPFPEMAAGLANGAIDLALMVEPFTSAAVRKGIAVEWIDVDDYVRPTPMEVLTDMVNTDWAAQNPELAQAIHTTLARGGREYCQAYHHGPNRDEVEDILVKYKAAPDRSLFENMPWQSRDPNGRFNMASVIDIQHWFFTHGMVDQELPGDRLVDMKYAAAADQALGPFVVANQASKLARCR